MPADPMKRFGAARQRVDHNCIVIELAAMAEDAGCSVELEPPHGQGKFADLLATGGDLPAPIAIEVTRFGFTRDTREASVLTEPLRNRLFNFDGQPGLHVSFRLGGVPSLDEFEAWVLEVERVARFHPVAVVRGPHNGEATIGPQTDEHPGAWGLRGPETSGDEWQRMAVRLQAKARQCAGGLPTWLHFTHDGFLFTLNSWLAGDHAVRLTQLQGNALPLLDSSQELRGLILTTTIGAHNPSGTIRAGDAVRHMEPATAREVYIVPATGTDLAEVNWWLDLYAEHEPAIWGLGPRP